MAKQMLKKLTKIRFANKVWWRFAWLAAAWRHQAALASGADCG